MSSQGSDCSDQSLFCSLSSSGLDGSVSRYPCAHARCQFSVCHLSWGLKIATHCCIVVLLSVIRKIESKSAKYNCRHMVPVPMHVGKFLYTVTFQLGLKIKHSRSALCSCSDLEVADTGSDIRWSTVRLFFADCYCIL